MQRPMTTARGSSLRARLLNSNLIAYTYAGMPPASPDELFAYLDGLGIAHQTVTHPPVFTVEEARALRGDACRRAHQEPVPARQEGRAVSGGGAGRRSDRAQIAASACWRLRALLVRLGGTDARNARRRARLGDAVRRHQRQDRPGDGHPRRRHDGARRAQLSSAGEYRHHDDFPRGPAQIPRSHRTPSPDRAGFGQPAS